MLRIMVVLALIGFLFLAGVVLAALMLSSQMSQEEGWWDEE